MRCQEVPHRSHGASPIILRPGLCTGQAPGRFWQGGALQSEALAPLCPQQEYGLLGHVGVQSTGHHPGTHLLALELRMGKQYLKRRKLDLSEDGRWAVVTLSGVSSVVRLLLGPILA